MMKKQNAEKLADLAIVHKNSGRSILVFVRTVDDLKWSKTREHRPFNFLEQCGYEKEITR